jgi:succinyl-CoA synthetase beta subunit
VAFDFIHYILTSSVSFPTYSTDPYLEFDTFAVKRVASLRELYASRVVDPNTDRAEKGGLFYVKLKNGGNIGAFGYGAGNAMATMDGLTLFGGKVSSG